MKPSKKIPINELVLDPRCQAREDISQDAVEDYRAAYEAKVDLPPLDVFMVDGKLYVVDGWHRMAAAVKAGVEWLRTVVVGTGTIDDAAWHALSANQANGLRRSNADKARAVRMALESAIGSEQSSRALADHIGVSHPFVSRVRAEWEAARNPILPEPTATQATGDVVTVSTSPEKRRDSAGRMQPATKPKRGDVVTVSTSTDADPPSVEHPVESDEPLPHEPGQMPPYGDELERVATMIGRVRVEACRASLPHTFVQSLTSGLKAVESMLRYAVPETCPRCKGAACIHCRQRGWVERSEGDGLRAGARSSAS